MASSTLGTLAQEVATLLRHDNLDTRIYRWLSLAWLDLQTRATTWRTVRHNVVSATVTASDPRSNAINFRSFRDILAVMYTYEDANFYLLKYVQQTDFSRIATATQGGDLAEGIPVIWTRSAATSTINMSFLVHPAPGVDGSLFFLVSGVSPTSLTNPAHNFPLPYHWENILIWGAAAIGAKALQSQLYPLFQGEYEEALQKMISMLTYRPDSTPVLRSVVSPYGGTVVGQRYRLPDNIPGS